MFGCPAFAFDAIDAGASDNRECVCPMLWCSCASVKAFNEKAAEAKAAAEAAAAEKVEKRAQRRAERAAFAKLKQKEAVAAAAAAAEAAAALADLETAAAKESGETSAEPLSGKDNTSPKKKIRKILKLKDPTEGTVPVADVPKVEDGDAAAVLKAAKKKKNIKKRTAKKVNKRLPRQWRQCDKASCGKWRGLPGDVVITTPKWYCSMNKWTKANSCSVPQEWEYNNGNPIERLEVCVKLCFLCSNASDALDWSTGDLSLLRWPVSCWLVLGSCC